MSTWRSSRSIRAVRCEARLTFHGSVVLRLLITGADFSHPESAPRAAPPASVPRCDASEELKPGNNRRRTCLLSWRHRCCAQMALRRPNPGPWRPLRSGDGLRTLSGTCPPPTCRRSCSTPKPSPGADLRSDRLPHHRLSRRILLGQNGRPAPARPRFERDLSLIARVGHTGRPGALDLHAYRSDGSADRHARHWSDAAQARPVDDRTSDVHRSQCALSRDPLGLHDAKRPESAELAIRARRWRSIPEFLAQCPGAPHLLEG